MSRLVNLPTILTDYLYPQKISTDVKGAGLEGGRNGLGETQSIEMTGGGLLVSTYSDCRINFKPQYEYINWLGARLNGSFRYINVIIPTDWWGPFPEIGGIPAAVIKGIPHSDTSRFTDTTGYSQHTVRGEIVDAAQLNAGIVRMRVIGLARPLRFSDWFSIYHPTKGWRAYRYWDVLAVTGDQNPVYTLAITPALREAISVGAEVEFANPRFAAKFKADFTLPSVVESFFTTQQSMEFVEAF